MKRTPPDQEVASIEEARLRIAECRDEVVREVMNLSARSKAVALAEESILPKADKKTSS